MIIGKRYELTLFGVMLTLAIIFYNHRNASSVYFNQFLYQNGNANYYNKVVLNYKDKLPLIFGKWRLLADTFFILDNLMTNLIFVFYKETREQLISLPMNTGGVKELYENMQQIAHYRYSKLTRIFNSGESVLENKEIDLARMQPVIEALSDIELRLVIADLREFSKYISEQNGINISETKIITSIENSFAKEVTFLFYIGLARQAEFLPEFKDGNIFPSHLSKFIEHGPQRRSKFLTSNIKVVLRKAFRFLMLSFLRKLTL